MPAAEGIASSTESSGGIVAATGDGAGSRARSDVVDRLAPRFEPTARGALDLPVTIVEFADFECPFSRALDSSLESTWTRFRDRVRWVVKAFPMPFHEGARTAHEAALVAGEWGRFWEMRSAILASEPPLTIDRLVELASELELPEDEFRELLEEGHLAFAVDQEIEEGRGLGVRGTPSLLVNGRLVTGAQPVDVLDYLVETALGLDPELPADAPAELLASDPERGHPFGFGPVDGYPLLKIFVDLRSGLGAQTLPLVEEILSRHGRRARVLVKACAPGVHADSQIAHEAALAFHARGVDLFRFWRRAHVERAELDAGTLASWAIEFGLGETVRSSVRAELESGVHRDIVHADLEHALRLQVRGSPAVVAGDGQRYDGVELLREVVKALDRAEDAALPGETVIGSASAASSEEGEERCDADEVPPRASQSLQVPPAGADGLPVTEVDLGVVALGSVRETELTIAVPVLEEGVQLVTRFTSEAVELPEKIERSTAESAVVRVRVRGLRAGEFSSPIVLGGVLQDGEPLPLPLAMALVRFRVSDRVRVVAPRGALPLRAREGESGEAVFELEFEDPLTVTFTPGRSDPSELAVRVDAIEPGRSRVVVTSPASWPTGRRAGTVLLAITGADVDEVAVPLDIVVHGEFLVSPPSLRGSAGLSRELRVRSASGALFAIGAVRSDVAGLRILPESSPFASTHSLLVDGSATTSADAGEILLEVSLIAESSGSTAPAGPARTLRIPWSGGSSE